MLRREVWVTPFVRRFVQQVITLCGRLYNSRISSVSVYSVTTGLEEVNLNYT